MAKEHVYIEVCGLFLFLTAKSPLVPTNKTMKSCRRVLTTGAFTLCLKTKHDGQLKPSFHLEVTRLSLQRAHLSGNRDSSQQSQFCFHFHNLNSDSNQQFLAAYTAVVIDFSVAQCHL